jgi:hypothetical protein
MKKDYPLTGFDKINFDEFMGIYEVLKLFNSLDGKNKEVIMLLMDGLKFRGKNEQRHRVEKSKKNV